MNPLVNLGQKRITSRKNDPAEGRDLYWHLRVVVNAAFCIYELDGFLSSKEVTADFIYVRLHGPGGPYQGSYDSAVLAEWTKIFVNWLAQGRSVYCYFDNDEKGYAAVNARTLQNMVAGVRQGQR